MLKLEFRLTAAAFTSDEERVSETARILRKLADDLDSGRGDLAGAVLRGLDHSARVFDVNDNSIGWVQYENEITG